MQLQKVRLVSRLRELLSDGKTHLRSELVYAVKEIVPPERAMRRYRRAILARQRYEMRKNGHDRKEQDRSLESKILRGLSRYLSDVTNRMVKAGEIKAMKIDEARAFRLNGKSKVISAR